LTKIASFLFQAFEGTKPIKLFYSAPKSWPESSPT